MKKPKITKLEEFEIVRRNLGYRSYGEMQQIETCKLLKSHKSSRNDNLRFTKDK